MGEQAECEFSFSPENGPPETAYHLKEKERLGEGFARSFQEQIEFAIRTLSRDGDAGDAIHQARKALKKSRVLLRFARPAIPGAYVAANPDLRNAGRKLSHVRDAEALLESMEKLRDDPDNEPDRPNLDRLHEDLVKRKNAIFASFEKSGDRSEIVEKLARWRHTGRSWAWERITKETVNSGVRRTVRRGLLAKTMAEQSRDSACFHEWRKRAKDLRYELGFLRKLWPEVLEGYADSAEDLEQSLGEDHNLAVLADLITTELRPHGEDKERLLNIVERAQKKLRKKAGKTGALLYSEKPKAWVKRLEACWGEWK